MTELILFSTLNGVLYGMLLFMMASGLTLIFSMMGVLNFAHASFYMLGAYFGFEISRHIGFWPGLIVAPLLVGVVGALVERFALRRVHVYGHVAELLFTFGLAFVLEELVQMFWGKLPVDYRVPPALDFVAFTMFGTTYPAYKLFMLAIAIAMFVVLFAILTRTRVGLIIQASLTHPNMVAMLGHDVPKVFMLVFGAGSLLAGLAGVIAGPALVTAAFDGRAARADPVRRRRGRRAGVAVRRLRRVAADRPDPDLRGGDERVAVRGLRLPGREPGSRHAGWATCGA